MRDPMRYVEKFCYKHPNFGIHNLMKYLVVGNVIFWLIGAVNPVLMSYLTFDAALILRGQVWRLVTFMFYPPSQGLLAFLVFYFYYWIGNTLEQQWGTPQFNVFIFSGAILTMLYGLVVYFITGYTVRLNAEYMYLSMFLSFAVLYPDMEVLLFFILPIKMKYLAYVDAVYFLLDVFRLGFPDNLLPVVAILNFLIFCGGELFSKIPQRSSASTVNFRRESKRIRKEQEQNLNVHKCSVCGRTDTDYPQLEFRYCSRCAGYHCFCQDHINNHIHFTE